VGLVDLLTGPEISLSIFYLGPVGLAAWYGGRGPGLLVSVCSAAAWLAAEEGGGPGFSSPWIPFWNTLVRLGHFMVTAELLSRLHERLDRETAMARTDALTGLLNARSFLEAVRAELARSSRYRRKFSIAYLDLDDFKAVNDQHGHDAGDALLRDVAHALRAAVRVTDQVARMSGDEFAVLLPETDERTADPVLKKLHGAVLDETSRKAWTVGVTVGGVTFATPPDTAEAAIRAGDSVMYAAKRAGKNRVLHEDRG
jgi:diguanylate cyclase (GGDEF)-like protein